MKTLFVPVIISFFVTLFVGKFLIPALAKFKASQTEREELKTHQVKVGTPTMGGIMFLVGTIAASLAALVMDFNVHVLAVLLMTIGFGFVGFLDDFLKIKKRSKDGLFAWQKLLMQVALTVGYFIYVMKTEVHLISMPFSGFSDFVSIPVVLYAVLFLFCICGTVNGVNFTDGVDGLATSVTLVVCAFFGYIACCFNDNGTAPVIGAVMGGLMAFLCYNAYPAKVFMGDTGSLALGGFVAAVAIELGCPWIIIVVGFIYLLEVVSVIMQVTYFKITHGKRIFKCAPIHHHFEMCDWSEVKVVAVFTIVTALLSMGALWLI